jgi:acetylornithine deacetylase/succinyl-diaminopimelate desuccinylase-like protein
VVAIADVCGLSNSSGFSDENVNMWTPAVGSNYDGVGLHGYNSPATLKVVRNTTGTPATLTTAEVKANPLPASCGAGLDITVTPTAAQLNRDLPAIDANGVQVWPQP